MAPEYWQSKYGEVAVTTQSWLGLFLRHVLCAVMDGFVQVDDCLGIVLDSLVSKASPFTAGVHEVVAGSGEFVHRRPHLRRHVFAKHRPSVARNFTPTPIGDERPESRSGAKQSKRRRRRYKSFLRQNAKAQVVKSLDHCSTAYLCLNIGHAPDTANCPDFLAPIN